MICKNLQLTRRNYVLSNNSCKVCIKQSSFSIEPELEKGEKHKVDDTVTVDKKHRNDIQRPGEENKQQTTNTVF